MLGTGILGWPSLAAPNFMCPIVRYWSYVLLHARGVHMGFRREQRMRSAALRSNLDSAVVSSYMPPHRTVRSQNRGNY
jgi:hypothetical protein